MNSITAGSSVIQRSTNTAGGNAHAQFSIVVTCHNQREFIRAAVDSAVAQLASLREVIVVDDGSTDGSAALLREYGDSILFLPLPENQGAIAARNHGAAHARGEYLVFLDGDDVLKPWALEVYERVIAARNPAVVLANTTWFKGPVPELDGKDVPDTIESIYYPALIRKDRSIGLSASAYVVARRTFWEVGGWSPGIFHLDLQDLSAKLGFRPTVFVSSPATVHYRYHGSNSITNVPPFLRNMRLLVHKERSGEYPGGRQRRFDRSVWFGGAIVFWMQRAAQEGLYAEAAKLGLIGWRMILAAALRRLSVKIGGLQPIERIELNLDRPKSKKAS
jgi:glycosyltransferase involved in cell wall biosynthesis